MLYTRIDILCANKIVYVIFSELSISGRVVARVCSEYIPQIDKTKRVTVVYPVFNNKVKYNLGYFIGNEGLAPTRVCWNDTTATPTLLPLANETKMGAKKTIYIQGGSILTDDNDASLIKEAKIMKVKVSGLYLESQRATQKGAEDYNYPLVKVFNRVWMRENYACELGSDYCRKQGAGSVFYTHEMLTKNMDVPSGWKIPSRRDFEQLKHELESNHVANPARALALKGTNLTGFNAIMNGWYSTTNGYTPEDWRTYFWSDEVNTNTKHYYIEVNYSSVNIKITLNADDKNCFSLRFVEVNQ